MLPLVGIVHPVDRGIESTAKIEHNHPHLAYIWPGVGDYIFRVLTLSRCATCVLVRSHTATMTRA